MTPGRTVLPAVALAGAAMVAGCSAGAGTVAAPTVHEQQALRALRGQLAGPTAVSPIFVDGKTPGVAIAVMKQQSNPAVPEVEIYRWVRKGWRSLAMVTLDVGGSVADDATGATTPIATAHITPSKVPDLVVTVHYNAGPATAVLSELGGHWHALTFHGGLAQDGDERFDVQTGADGSLRSHENDCIPNCAQGHLVTTVYRFDPRTGGLDAQTNR